MEQLSFFNPPRQKLPTLVGYNLSAKNPENEWIATYRDAATLQSAFDLCVEEFPPEEGWIDLTVMNIETMVETSIER